MPAHPLPIASLNLSVRAEGLRWFDWGRYSQRQQQEMQLGGLLGSVHLQGDLAPFAQLLHLGQWLHVGKNASFGLGGYRRQAVAGLSAASHTPRYRVSARLAVRRNP